MVRIVMSDELDSMAETMRSVLAQQSPAARVAEIADGPDDHDSTLWKTLSRDLGVTGVLVPDEHGGLGLGWREARVVLGALGRSLACVPFLSSSVLAVVAVISSGDESVAMQLLPGIADGSSIVTVAIGEESWLADQPTSTVEAGPSGDGWQLHGTARFVTDGMTADHVLVPARLADGRTALFLVDPAGQGFIRERMTVVDATRPLAVLRFDAVDARLVGEPGEAEAVVGPIMDAGVLALACEQVAASEHVLGMTVDYARTRFQFGQPIGSFQAIKHRLADLALLVDQATSALEYAVWAAADSPETLREAVSIAGFVCAEAMHTATLETIQLHGGIGFTWEHPAHRYYRRALASSAQLGRPSQHRERLLRAISV